MAQKFQVSFLSFSDWSLLESSSCDTLKFFMWDWLLRLKLSLLGFLVQLLSKRLVELKSQPADFFLNTGCGWIESELFMVGVFELWDLSLEPVLSPVHWRLSFFEPSFQFWRKKGLRHRFFLITSAKNVFLSSCSKNNINNNHFSISLSSNADKPPRNDSLSRGMLVGLLQVDFSKEIMQHLMQQSAISSRGPQLKFSAVRF